MTSYSFTIGFAVGPGEDGLFYTTAAGIGTGSSVDLSGGISAFWSDKTDDVLRGKP